MGRKPLMNMVKINIYVAFDSKVSFAGLSTIVRNHKRTIMHVVVKRKEVRSALTAEVEALLKGV